MDKIKNETKHITIESYNIIGELNKIMQSSKDMINLIRIIELKIIIKGRIYENVIDNYLKSGCIPILWKRIFVKIVRERDNLYNRPERFIQHCRQRHFCRFQ